MSLLLAAYAATSLFVQAIGCATATIPSLRTASSNSPIPPTSLLRPVSGLHPDIEATLTSSFTLTGAEFEVVFCAPSAADPAVPLVRKLIAAHPNIRARLLIGIGHESFNPKIDNLQKGWRAAVYPHVMMVDSNVLLAPDTLIRAHRLLAQKDVGLVTSPPRGIAPVGFAAELEIAFLNGHQLRWQLLADSLGTGFAQGKLLFLRKETLGPEGLDALTQEYAEDAAATKFLRAANLRVALLRPPVAQPIGQRDFASVWARQERWAQLRWNSFPLQYLPEILSSGALPILAAFIAFGKEALLLLFAWYAIEALMLRANGWHLSAKQLCAMLLRDALMPALWIIGLCKRSYSWNGNIITLHRRGPQHNEKRDKTAKS